MKKLAEIHALWIGSSLGEMSSCCLSSFLKRGHVVYLHTYSSVDDIPEGIVVKDANLIIPESKIIRHRETGSFALFSDIFRYELLHQTGNNSVYVDCDVYCLAPIIVPDHGYLFGFEDDKYVNGAILALPSDSQILKQLLRCAYDPLFVPPWYSKSKQLRYKLKKRIGLGRKIEDMPWGIIGPMAITYYVKSLGLVNLAQKADVFYPVHYLKVKGYLMDESLSLIDMVTSRTICFHLYNEMLKDIDLDKIAKECVLNQFLEKKV